MSLAAAEWAKPSIRWRPLMTVGGGWFGTDLTGHPKSTTEGLLVALYQILKRHFVLPGHSKGRGIDIYAEVEAPVSSNIGSLSRGSRRINSAA